MDFRKKYGKAGSAAAAEKGMDHISGKSVLMDGAGAGGEKYPARPFSFEKRMKRNFVISF